jgi:type VI secretion system protein
MATGGSLFERLADAAPTRFLTEDESVGRFVDSVLAHLRKMLNTRQGDSLAAPDYGMPDITDFAQFSADEVQMGIKRSIENFEPRLKKPVRVTCISSKDEWPRLRFEIVAGLLSPREKVRVRFESTVEESGHIEIEG